MGDLVISEYNMFIIIYRCLFLDILDGTFSLLFYIYHYCNVIAIIIIATIFIFIDRMFVIVAFMIKVFHYYQN